MGRVEGIPGRFYDREGKRIGLEELDRLMSDRDYAVVKQNRVGEHMVSTIWFGIDMNYHGGPPLIFETGAFACENDCMLGRDVYMRSATEKEALKNHKDMMSRLEKCNA